MKNCHIYTDLMYNNNKKKLKKGKQSLIAKQNWVKQTYKDKW